MSSVDHSWTQFLAKVIINEVAPVYDRVFSENEKQRTGFYRMSSLTEWVRQLTVLYYDKTISKTVFRELLEWHCWRTLIAATGSLKALRAYNDFCEKSTNFSDCAHEFDSGLTEEEAEYVRSLR